LDTAVKAFLELGLYRTRFSGHKIAIKRRPS
jgi:hypothetical protein